MKVSILSLNSYNILSGSNVSQHVGGAETQIVSVGEGLARRGHDVSFICLDHGQPDGLRMQSGIQIFKSFAPEAGLPGVRFIWPKITSVWSALGRAYPDVCIQAGSDSWTGVAAGWCRKHKRKFAFVVMSDANCDIQLQSLKTRRDRVMFRYGLKRSDSIIVQTNIQREMLRRNYGLQSSVIRPCSKAAGSGSIVGQETENNTKNILWIGRFNPVKRLEWFLDIAERCPSLTFHIVGRANSETSYSKGLESRAEALPNVVMHGYVPHDKITQVYRSCGILVSTSHYEGFPTTFIEAWANSLPTITSFDPDGIVAKHKLGYVSKSVDDLVAGICNLSDHPEEYKKVSLNARRFYEKNHDPDNVAASFEQIMMQIS